MTFVLRQSSLVVKILSPGGGLKENARGNNFLGRFEERSAELRYGLLRCLRFCALALLRGLPPCALALRRLRGFRLLDDLDLVLRMLFEVLALPAQGV